MATGAAAAGVSGAAGAGSGAATSGVAGAAIGASGAAASEAGSVSCAAARAKRASSRKRAMGRTTTFSNFETTGAFRCYSGGMQMGGTTFKTCRSDIRTKVLTSSACLKHRRLVLSAYAPLVSSVHRIPEACNDPKERCLRAEGREDITSMGQKALTVASLP